MVFISKNRTFLRATPLIPQFRRYPGFQRETVRATLENCNFSGAWQGFDHRHFLLTLSFPYGKPISRGIRENKKEKQRKKKNNKNKRDSMMKK